MSCKKGKCTSMSVPKFGVLSYVHARYCHFLLCFTLLFNNVHSSINNVYGNIIIIPILPFQPPECPWLACSVVPVEQGYSKGKR